MYCVHVHTLYTIIVVMVTAARFAMMRMDACMHVV